MIELMPQSPPRDALDQLRDCFAGLRRSPIRIQVGLCRALAAFIGCNGPRWLGHTQRDYVRARLGVPSPTFYTWLRAGRALLLSPDLQSDVLAGCISLGVVDVLARSASSAEELELMLPMVGGRTVRDARLILNQFLAETAPETGTPPESERPTPSTAQTDPRYQRTCFVMPSPVATYMDETLQLVTAMAGQDVPEDQQFAAVIAEACSELDITVDLDEVRRRFKLDPTAAKARPAPDSARLPSPPSSHRSERAQRRAARILHRYILRQLKRLERLDFDLEDLLLQLLNDRAHHRSDYARFEDFAHDALDLPRSTVWDKIRRARLRTSNHPVALARTEGRLTAVKSDMLHRLERQVHVPRSSLGPWIDLAEQTTTLRLRDAIHWARTQRDRDYTNWCNRGCPPPTAAQLRTSNRPLEDIAQNPNLPDTDLHAAARTKRHYTLEIETLEITLQLMASLQDRHSDGPCKLPEWRALLEIFHIARQSWAHHHQKTPGYQGRTLQRDRWRCQAPECTERKSLQIHHIDYRSRGGDDTDENLVTLCAFHHLIGEHQHRILHVEGKATDGADSLTWRVGTGSNAQYYREGRLMN